MDKFEPVPARVVWLALGAILLVAAVGQAALWWMAPDLPNPIATHWGFGAEPNQFGTLAGLALVAAVLGILLPGFLLGLGTMLRAAREMAAVSVGTAALVQAIFVGMLWGQRGLSDARDARMGPGMLWGLLAALLAGGLTWLLVRRRGPLPRATAALPADAARLDVSERARVSWTGHLRVGGGARVLSFIGLGVLVALAGIFVFVGDWWGAIFLLVVAVAISILLSSMWSAVTVDGRGVRARGAFGIPWLTIPLDNIEAADVSKVSPMGDFGGYGIRTGFDGRRGLVTAEGEVLRVQRAGMPDAVISVADPAAAAAALNTLVGRRVASRG